MDRQELRGVLDALRAADEDIARTYDETARQADEPALRDLLFRLGRGHRADASEIADEMARAGERVRGGRAGRWGTGGYGTGDQFGGGEAGGAGGFPSAGPSYSGGEDDLNTGE